jgi:hypothetical protein
MSEQDRRIADAIEREQGRLRNFIRKRVPDRRDVEDVLQDVFFELRRSSTLTRPIPDDEEGDIGPLEDLLPSPDAGPKAAYRSWSTSSGKAAGFMGRNIVPHVPCRRGPRRPDHGLARGHRGFLPPPSHPEAGTLRVGAP